MPDVPKLSAGYFARPSHGPGRSVRRLRRHARHRHQRDAARDSAAAALCGARDVRIERSGRGGDRRPARRSGEQLARRRAARRRPPWNTSTTARLACCQTRRSRRPASRGHPRRRCCCSFSSKCRSDDDEALARLDDRARVMRRGGRPGAGAAWRRTRRRASLQPARGRACEPQRADRRDEGARAIRAFTRPRAT